MSRIRYQVKENGRRMLMGNWMKSVLILVLISLMLFGLGALETAYRTAFGVPLQLSDGMLNISRTSFLITGAFTLLTLLFLPPLFMGQTEWYWNLSGGKRTGIGEVFGWFGSFRLYRKSVGLFLNLFVRYLLWTVLTCTIPTAMILWADYYYYPTMRTSTLSLVLASVLVVAGFILLLGAVFLLLVIMTRYTLAPFLLAEDNSSNIREAVKLSVLFTKGYRWELTKFYLSFTLWLLTCYFVFPIFYVIPYLFASTSVMSRHIIFTRRAAAGNMPKREEEKTGGAA